MIESRGFQQGDLLLLRVQQLQVVVAGEEHHARVRMKGEEHALPFFPFLADRLSSRSRIVRWPTMDAIERAGSQHRSV
jgi:hypothetical protein